MSVSSSFAGYAPAIQFYYSAYKHPAINVFLLLFCITPPKFNVGLFTI